MSLLELFGRTFYWLCVGVGLFMITAVTFAAVRDNHLHYIFGPAWVAAILYMLGRTVRNWTARPRPSRT
jgi:hypothetical protein